MEEITAINTWKRRVGQRRGWETFMSEDFSLCYACYLSVTQFFFIVFRVSLRLRRKVCFQSRARRVENRREREREKEGQYRGLDEDRAIGEYGEKKRERFSLKLKMGEHVRD